jgi:hypothetical protein
MLASFILPIILKKYLILLNCFMAIIWVVIIAVMPKTIPQGNMEFILRESWFYMGPTYIFGTVIALKQNQIK